MQRNFKASNLIQKLKNQISSILDNPAYRVILGTINHHRRLILVNIHANLFAAALEGTTFGSIYLALQVLQPQQPNAMPNHPFIADTFLSGLLQELSQGQLFIGLIAIAVLMQFLRHSLEYVGKVSSDYLSARIQAQMVERIFRQITGLGVVSQDTFIFNESILENIRYGKPDATEAQVKESAIAAQADRFVQQLPNGYTVVGERGYRLSGGQRQRLALARSILKEPEILILDEATSALDSHSEHLVQQALKEFQRDVAEPLPFGHRTVLVIAHRLSTIVNADQIIVLEQGKVVEQGSHQELFNQGGKYLEYWRLQSESQSSHVT